MTVVLLLREWKIFLEQKLQELLKKWGENNKLWILFLRKILKNEKLVQLFIVVYH